MGWIWRAAGLLILLLLPSQLLHPEPVWMLSRAKLQNAAVLPGLYFGAGLLLAVLRRRTAGSIVHGMLVAACVLAVWFAVLLDLGIQIERRELVMCSVLGTLFLLGPPSIRLVRSVAVVVALLGVLAVLAVLAADLIRRGDSPGRQRVLQTAYHVVHAAYYLRLRRNITEGGGISALGHDFLAVSGDGAFFHLAWRGDTLRARRLALAAPLDRERFRKGVPSNVNARLFRVAHLVVQESGEAVRLVVSHHHWDSAGRCFALRVSTLDTSKDALLADKVVADWVSLFETRPCLPLKDRSFAFGGLQNGGRMALLDARTLLLTVGDHEFDGRYSDVALPLALDNDYGKTLRISLDDGRAELFTIGHRNPQGLHVTPDGAVWLTEHGPAGGDELNALVPGGNYGWPTHTYGVDYEEGSLPFPEPDHSSVGMTPPVHAWIPSIGISNVRDVQGTRFEHWSGDLLIGSLRAQTLYRVHRYAGSVVYIEPIEVGERIRDLVEGPDGRIVLWTDSGRVVSMRPVEDDAAAALFRHCLSCHVQNDASGIAPDLTGVVGRRVAAVADFNYSDALKTVGGRWTESRLDAFLKSPANFSPGNAMAFAGISDDQLRAELIEIIKGTGDP